MPSTKLIEMEFLLQGKARAAGLKYRVTCWDRTPVQQAALFVQGRYDRALINIYRQVAGLPAIDAMTAKLVVTKTLDSRHLRGEAFDVVLFDKRARAHYNLKENANDNLISDYQELAELWRALGGKPGIDFGDAPHMELA